ncbi:LamG-like jellyroll fold domain-containing protein [Roseiflexus sp.]|uniref:LamG domain-containing protein n=1 Tax=Roseiflexus sp. TaxID=2562120 RepID=UPI00398B733C
MLPAFVVLLALVSAHPVRAQGDFSLRFYGTGRDGVDRVIIPLDTPPRPVDVADDFTIEFWLKALPGENAAPPCFPSEDNWIYGNVVIDRDVYFAGDYGDYGISLADGRVTFGVNNGAEGTTLCGRADVADGRWHHIAVTRSAADGALAIFVDGQLDMQGSGPIGNVSYRDGRSTQYPADPFLVIGAEKHDAGPEYPSFRGWIDEVRISRVVRYRNPFEPPVAPFTSDVNTVALYHFDEGAGAMVYDTSDAPGGPSHGMLRIGGSPAGPIWSDDTPWKRLVEPASIPTPTAQPSPKSTVTETDTPVPSETASPIAAAPSATPVVTAAPSFQKTPATSGSVPSPVAASPTTAGPPFWFLGIVVAGVALAGVGLILMLRRKE